MRGNMTHRRDSGSREQANAFANTIMAPSIKSKMKNLITTMEKEKKARTHSLTQKLSLSSHLESVAF